MNCLYIGINFICKGLTVPESEHFVVNNGLVKINAADRCIPCISKKYPIRSRIISYGKISITFKVRKRDPEKTVFIPEMLLSPRPQLAGSPTNMP